MNLLMTSVKRKIFLGCFLSLAIVAFGCATKDAPSTKAISNEALGKAVIPTSWQTETSQGSVTDSWLASFGDKALIAIVSEAQINNLGLRGAKASLDQAAAEAKVAGASLAPQVNVSGSAAERGSSLSDSVSNRGAGLNVSWELDVWGRLRSQRDSASESYEGAKLDYEFARQSLAAAVAKAWFLAIESNLQVGLIQNNINTYNEMIRVLDARSKSGKQSDQDLFLVRSELSSASEKQQRIKTVQEQSARALEILLGRYPSGEIATAKALPRQPKTVPAGLPSEILERRPDIAAAERVVRAAFKNVEASKLAKLPKISLSANLGTSHSQLSSLTGNNGFFNIASNFTAPIFDGGKLDAEIEIATAQQEKAFASYGQAALIAFSEVENELSLEQSLALQEKFIQAEVSDLQQALRIRKLEEQSGKADILTVLQLQAKIDLARSKLILLQATRLSERVNLHLALGGSFS